MITAYSQDRMGRVIRRIVHGGASSRHPRGDRRPDRHFSQTLLRNYYTLECEQGSKFRSTYTKNQIKRVHDTRLELFDQTGRER
jgi:hypothetical protein